jgi:RHS repeat-associated protein
VGGVAKVQYVYSPADGSLIERDRDATGNGQLSERLYAQTDANGDVTALVNAAGQVVERYVYDPYGTVTVLDANWNQRAGSQYAWRYLFQGGRYDPATGYYHFGARDYSPRLSSWLEQDPLGLGAGDPNVYPMEGNNPTNEVDPLGLWPVGHHYLPVSVLTDPEISRRISVAARNLALGTFTGPTTPAHGGGTYGGITHPQYSREVRRLLLEYMDRIGATSSPFKVSVSRCVDSQSAVR